MSSNPSWLVVEFSDDTAVIGLISDNDEAGYRRKVGRLVGWFSNNKLVLNVSKTREAIIDFRREKSVPSSLLINGVAVQSTGSFKFLGFTITSDLSWANYCSLIVKRCQTRLHFLRQLKEFGFRHTILARFYHAVIESILCFGVSVWFGAIASRDKDGLECILRQASRIAGCDFPSIASLYDTRLYHRAGKISVDSSHPASHLFELLPSGRCYRAIEAKTRRFRHSFFPEAIRVIQPFSTLHTASVCCGIWSETENSQKPCCP